MRQWIRVAHDLGAKYAILVAKYISGSCLWPAKGYDYSVANSGNKTDVVRAFVDACNEYGLKAGFYYCILDPHNEGTFEKFDWDSLIPDHVFEIVKRQVAELHQRQQPGIQAEPRKSGEYVRASQLAVRRHQWKICYHRWKDTTRTLLTKRAVLHDVRNLAAHRAAIRRCHGWKNAFINI